MSGKRIEIPGAIRDGVEMNLGDRVTRMRWQMFAMWLKLWFLFFFAVCSWTHSENASNRPSSAMAPRDSPIQTRSSMKWPCIQHVSLELTPCISYWNHSRCRFSFCSVRVQAVKITKRRGSRRIRQNCTFRRIFLINWCRTHSYTVLFSGKWRIPDQSSDLKSIKIHLFRQTLSTESRHSATGWQKSTAIGRTGGRLLGTGRHGSRNRVDHGEATHSRR